MKYNDLMSEKYKKTSRYLDYVQHLLILVSIVTGCVSISAFHFCIGFCSCRYYEFCSRKKNYVITTIIKNYKSVINKRKKQKHDKTVLLWKAQLNNIEFLISKAFFDSYIIHDEFVSVNIGLREYNEMKEEMKNPETSVEFTI